MKKSGKFGILGLGIVLSLFFVSFAGFVSAACGDAIVTPPEQCDNGDGIYPNWYCFGPGGTCNSDTGVCNTNCQKTSCGDGIVQVVNGQNQNEICDSTPGCGNFCLCSTALGYKPVYSPQGPPGCMLACGDAVVDSLFPSPYNEECDLGSQNDNAIDCNINCKKTKCGDGIVQATNGQNQQEICDSSPGCTSSCTCDSDFGYKSNSAGADCITACGDNIIDLNMPSPYEEECDNSSDTNNLYCYSSGHMYQCMERSCSRDCQGDQDCIDQCAICVEPAGVEFNNGICENGEEKLPCACSKDCNFCKEFESARIKNILLNVPSEYKKDRFLTSYYEKLGLSALKFQGCIGKDIECSAISEQTACNSNSGCLWLEKCQDCGTQEEKDRITGIISEYDDLQVETLVTFDTKDRNEPNLYDYYVSSSIYGGNYVLPWKTNLIDCVLLYPNTLPLIGHYVYSCPVNIDNEIIYGVNLLLNRGTKIYAKSELFKTGQIVSSSEESNYLVVAKYLLHVFPINFVSEREDSRAISDFSDSYIYFNQKSEINIDISNSAKFITHTLPILTPSPIIAGRLFAALSQTSINLLMDMFGWNEIYDRIIVYLPNDDAHKACGSPACAMGLSGQGIIMSLYLGGSALAHELGHVYSGLLDEYNITHWYQEKKSQNNIPINPVFSANNVRFPQCCYTDNYYCYKYTVKTETSKTTSILGSYHVSLSSDSEEYFSWLPAAFSNNLLGQSFPVYDSGPLINAPEGTITNIDKIVYSIVITGSNDCLLYGTFYSNFGNCGIGSTPGNCIKGNCGIGSTPGNCIKPSLRGMGKCGSLQSCSGMPYSDKLGKQPNDIDFETDANKATTFSIMGTTTGWNVFPENSICPLKNC